VKPPTTVRAINYYELRFDRVYVGPAAGGEAGDSRAAK